MKVHTSNYRILGFTQEVTLKEMVDLGKEMNLPVIYDMGSGLMADLTRYGVDEPTVLDAVNDGQTWCFSPATSFWEAPRAASSSVKRNILIE